MVIRQGLKDRDKKGSINVIEVRKLKPNELKQLINEAPASETRFIKEIKHPYIHFQRAKEQSGILNSRPLYFGALMKDGDRYILWTIVNKNVKQQFSLFKISKRTAQEWAKKYGRIYATMYKGNIKNLQWTKRIGFKPIKEDDETITLCLTGGK